MNLQRNILIALASVALLAMGIMLWQTLTSMQRAAQARQDTKGADAYAGAAKGAVAVVVANAEGQATLSEVVTVAAKEIAAAEGADQPITPAARNAALTAACRLPAYRGEARCAALR